MSSVKANTPLKLKNRNINLENSRRLNEKKWNNLPKSDPYLKVAKSMESEFIKLMLENMQNTVIKDKKDSGEESYYRSLLTRERANLMAENGDGVGLKNLILEQIYPKK